MKNRILNNKILAPLSVFVLTTILLFVLFSLNGFGISGIIFSLGHGKFEYLYNKKKAESKERRSRYMVF